MAGSKPTIMRVRWETVSHHVADVPADQVPCDAAGTAGIFSVAPIEAWLDGLHEESREVGSASRLLEIEEAPRARSPR